MRILISNIYRDIDYNKDKSIYEAWPVGKQYRNRGEGTVKIEINCPTKDQKALGGVLTGPDYNNLIPKIESISNSIAEHTGPDFNEDYYWDYRDSIQDDDVVNFINNNLGKHETEEDAMYAWYNYIEEKSEWMYYAEDEYYHQVFNNWILDEGDEEPWDIKEYFNTYLDMFYYNFNRSHFDSQDIDMHVYLLSKHELNYDLGPVGELASWYNEYRDKGIDFNDDCFNPDVCFVSYLTQQQGYTMKQLFDKRQRKSKYINSMRSELANFFHVCGATTVLQRETIGYWIKNLCVKDGHYNLKSQHIGLYAPVVGGGSMFEIELDKPVSLHNSYVSGVDSRGSKSRYGYTPEETYGWTGDMYK